jgi:hypothetical protein
VKDPFINCLGVSLVKIDAVLIGLVAGLASTLGFLSLYSVVGPNFEWIVNYLMLVYFVLILVTFVRLLLYRRSLYYDSNLGINDPEWKAPRKCVLCGKHPVSSRYHIKRVHNLNHNNFEHFQNCGCEICNPPPQMAGWASP